MAKLLIASALLMHWNIDNMIDDDEESVDHTADEDESNCDDENAWYYENEYYLHQDDVSWLFNLP